MTTPPQSPQNSPPTPAAATPVAPDSGETARLEAYVSIWSKAVDTQMHFNEMSVKSRQFGLTFVAAALGLGILLLSRKDDFSLVVSVPSFGPVNLHISALIFIAAAVAIYAVSILDLRVYHRMLRGAVSFGEDFEEHYLKQIVALDKGMTQAVSHFSRYDDATVRNEGGRLRYSGSALRSAEKKIRRFYRIVIFGLLLAAGAIIVVTSLAVGPAPKASATAPSKVDVSK